MGLGCCPHVGDFLEGIAAQEALGVAEDEVTCGLDVGYFGMEEALGIAVGVEPLAAIEGCEIVGMDGGKGGRGSALDGLVTWDEGVDDGVEDEAAVNVVACETEERGGGGDGLAAGCFADGVGSSRGKGREGEGGLVDIDAAAYDAAVEMGAAELVLYEDACYLTVADIDVVRPFDADIR